MQHATAPYVCIYILWWPQRTHLEVIDYENKKYGESMTGTGPHISLILKDKKKDG